MAPFDLAPLAHTLGYDLIFLVIGMGFGAALELSGFGDSRKLAAQFYLRDMTVLKVMFTAIIVAAVLIFLASSFELLDFNRVWVNPTYLSSEIVGGLIMGVGFIVGGFCPGTSLVAASTLKIDGMFFVLGVGVGVGLFGETVHLFEGFFNATFMGRFTIPDWLGLPYGVVVVLLILMALAMFWGAELCEAFFGRRRLWKDISILPESRAKMFAAGALLLLALVVAFKGQPTVDDRWSWIAPEGERQIEAREVQADPIEVVELKKDLTLRVDILDVRKEEDFNRFHIAGARRIMPGDVYDPSVVQGLLAAPDNTIVFLVSNGEAEATRTWKALKAQGVLNSYIIAGGIDGWLDRYPPSPCVATRVPGANDEDRPRWRFSVSVGERSTSAHPDLPRKEYVPACALAIGGTKDAAATEGDTTHHAKPDFLKKVKLQKKTVAKGGCG